MKSLFLASVTFFVSLNAFTPQAFASMCYNTIFTHSILKDPSIPNPVVVLGQFEIPSEMSNGNITVKATVTESFVGPLTSGQVIQVLVSPDDASLYRNPGEALFVLIEDSGLYAPVDCSATGPTTMAGTQMDLKWIRKNLK